MVEENISQEFRLKNIDEAKNYKEAQEGLYNSTLY